jgi:hypothetical protein
MFGKDRNLFSFNFMYAFFYLETDSDNESASDAVEKPECDSGKDLKVLFCVSKKSNFFKYRLYYLAFG